MCAEAAVRLVCLCSASADHLSSLSESMSFFQYAFCSVLYSFLSRFTCASLAEYTTLMTVCAASSSASAVAPSSSSSALDAMPTSSEMVIFLDWMAKMPGAGLVLS